ncbi:MAG: hypothetical protein NDI94_04825 [Candidatus Woesearchaeota archaeon]|nr:hypothetical protein [Candidatus Woesearchaeota archaeon]
MIKNKKAQLEIMQSAFSLLIIFFIIAIAVIFFVVQMKSMNNQKLDQFLIISQIKKSKNIALLPEVQFTSENIAVSDHYDKAALMAFKEIIDNNQIYYRPLFQNVKLRLDEYDFKTGWKEQVIFDYSPKQFSDMKEFQIPVALTDPEEYRKSFGVIYLEVYS